MVAILMIFCLFILKTRSVLLAALLLGFVYLFIERWKLFLVTIPVFFLLITALYYFKEDSADGRLLIWKTSMGLIRENPIFGLGKNGFSKNYMIQQAEYFQANPGSEYSLLADQVNHPFNEYILWLIDYGVIVFSIICYSIIRWFKNIYFIYNIDKIVVFFILVASLFSYTFKYYFVIVILVFCFSNVENCRLKFRIHVPRRMGILLILIFVTTACSMFIYIRSEIHWKAATNSIMFDEKKYLTLEKELNQISEFHHDLAYKLFEHGEYKKSIAQIEKYESMRVNYDVTLLKAFNFTSLGEHHKSSEHFFLAKYMVPSRFLPKYELFRIYKEIYHDQEASINIAREIDQTPIKVKTDYTISVKSEVRKFLKEHKTTK
ncbi:O-antigen ligase family protein [Flagellimonas aequoris]|uniref:O-antigen ligase family protein n=2 Tax=Flagellimonas aequoris TaxID=2306997 RepID=A0ABY3KVR8_9FLAO|nr:O-antigen ligase family protein [Allomuricauda aequoris]